MTNHSITKGLVSSKEIAKAVKLDKFGFLGTFIGWILLKLFKNIYTQQNL